MDLRKYCQSCRLAVRRANLASKQSNIIYSFVSQRKGEVSGGGDIPYYATAEQDNCTLTNLVSSALPVACFVNVPVLRELKSKCLNTEQGPPTHMKFQH